MIIPLDARRREKSLKLIIQIPCYNETGTLAVALSELLREILGIKQVEWLIVDDGSSDGTVEVARTNGVDHIVRHHTNLGLARAFMTGLQNYYCFPGFQDFIQNPTLPVCNRQRTRLFYFLNTL